MKYYPTYIESLVLMGIWLLCTLISVLIVLPFYSLESGIGLSIIYTLSMAMTVTAALNIRKNFKFPTRRFSILIIPVGFISLTALSVALDPITSMVPESGALRDMLAGILSQPLPYFFMLVIAAPVLEELMFRGVILDGLLKNYDPKKAIGFSALLFGLIHGNLEQGIGAALMGVLVGWIYYKTKSVIPGIILHLLNNLFSFVMVSILKEDANQQLDQMIGDKTIYWLLAGGCLFITCGGVFVLHKILPKQEIFHSPEQESND